MNTAFFSVWHVLGGNSPGVVYGGGGGGGGHLTGVIYWGTLTSRETHIHIH